LSWDAQQSGNQTTVQLTGETLMLGFGLQRAMHRPASSVKGN
jgi:hypothetical protein